MGLVINVALALFLGFLASLLIQQLMKLFLGLRANWLLIFIATSLAAGVCAVCFSLAAQNFDPKSSTYFLRIFGSSLATSTICGLVGFRLNVHSDHGDHLSWGASLAMTAVAVLPVLGILSLLHLVSA